MCSILLASAGRAVFDSLGGVEERMQEAKLLELRRVERPRSSAFPPAKVQARGEGKPMARHGERERARRLRQMGRLASSHSN